MVRIVILAAGKGKRMGAEDLPKVLFPLKGRPLLAYLLDAVHSSGVDARPVLVVGHLADKVRETCGEDCEYVMQEEQRGTGDAVRMTRPTLEEVAEHVMVLNGDSPLLSAHTIRKMIDMHLASDATLTMGTVNLDEVVKEEDQYSDWGRVVRGSAGRVKKIVEAKDATVAELAAREVNPGIFCFKAGWLWPQLESLTSQNSQGEYYLTDLLGNAIQEEEVVTTVPIPPNEAVGVNTPQQLAFAEQLLEHRK